MRWIAVFSILLAAVTRAETPASALWGDLKAKRDKLPGFHQEFDVSRTYITSHGDQSSKYQIVVDASQGRWREKIGSGSGNEIRIYDGKELLRTEDGSEEYTRTKRRPKDDDFEPCPYCAGDPEWRKAVEIVRRPCGFSGTDHVCVVVDVPLKKSAKVTSPTNITRMTDGFARAAFDTETGLLMSIRTVQMFEYASGSHKTDVTYSMKRMSFGAALEASLFELPSTGMREVQTLTNWDAPRMKKQLVGKPAPELVLTDLSGKPVSLSTLRGKTVLLDFWTTWCPPCRADGPALDKLQSKYGGQELAIVGISVSEERAVVEKFLKQHPHEFPVTLTSENEMPRPFQIGVFPTYVVIGKDGAVSAAMQGGQGLADLTKVLRKAGLESE